MGRYPVVTEADILKFREFCLKREAENNRPGSRYSRNVDLYRDIYFYHHIGGNWYLRRDWRDEWNKKYPNHPVDPVSTLRPRKEYVDRRRLRDFVGWIGHYDRTVFGLVYGNPDNPRRWILLRRIDGEVKPAESWANSIEAHAALKEMYDTLKSQCPKCGCDWRQTKRYRDANEEWHCGGCHTGDTELRAMRAR